MRFSCAPPYTWLTRITGSWLAPPPPRPFVSHWFHWRQPWGGQGRRPLRDSRSAPSRSCVIILTFECTEDCGVSNFMLECNEHCGVKDFTLGYTEEGERNDQSREGGCGVTIRALEYIGDGGGSALSPEDGNVKGTRAESQSISWTLAMQTPFLRASPGDPESHYQAAAAERDARGGGGGGPVGALISTRPEGILVSPGIYGRLLMCPMGTNALVWPRPLDARRTPRGCPLPRPDCRPFVATYPGPMHKGVFGGESGTEGGTPHTM